MHDASLAARFQALHAELAHGLQHGVLRDAGWRVRAAHEAVRHQRPQFLQHIQGVVRAERLHAIERAAAVAHRYPSEECLGAFTEQPVTPGNGAAQAALPRRTVLRATVRQRQPALELGQQRGGRQHGNPGRRQLDGQRQAIQPLTDTHHGGGIVAAQREIGIQRLRAVDEQAARLQLQRLLHGHGNSGPQAGQWERTNIDDVLTRDSQDDAAGHQQLQVRTGIQELREERRGREDLLEVIEHQLTRSRRARPTERIQDRPAIRPHIERGGNRGQDEGGLLHIRQIDEPGRGRCRDGRLDGGARLADPARTGQCDQPHLVAGQVRPHPFHLARSSNKCGARRWRQASVQIAGNRKGEKRATHAPGGISGGAVGHRLVSQCSEASTTMTSPASLPARRDTETCIRC